MKPFRLVQLNRSNPLARGLVGCWLFNEGCGRIVTDISGNNNNGTLCNNATWAAGRFGTCLSFDGTDDYVDCGPCSRCDSATKTISFWFRPNSFANYARIIAAPLSFANNFQVLFDANSNLAFSRCPAVNSGRYITGISTGIWYHIVITDAGSLGSVAFYVNGVAVSTYLLTGNYGHNSGNFRFGGRQDNQYFYNGLLDSVMIWNRVLSAKEAALLYREPYSLFEPAKPAGYLLPVQNKWAVGNAQADCNADADADIITYISQSSLLWRQDALFNAATARAIRLGTVLSMGWFWNRPFGCIVLYNSISDNNIDKCIPVCVADSDAQQLAVPVWVQPFPGEKYFYLAKKYNGFGRSSSCYCPVAKVSFDGSGKLIRPKTGSIYNFSARQTGSSTVEFSWFYNSLNQQIAPGDFKLFWDSGSGQINYETPLEYFNYRGSGYYGYTKIGGFPQRCKFGLCAADDDGKCGPMSYLEIYVNSNVARQSELMDIVSL